MSLPKNMDGPTVFAMDLEDPEQSIRHPGLRTMMNEGWGIGTSFVGQRAGKTELYLLMTPPKAETLSIPKSVTFLLLVAVGIGSLIGTLIANILPA
jgi:hypothetical protein